MKYFNTWMRAGALAFVAFFAAGAIAFSRPSAKAAEAPPSTAGMTDLITENSTASMIWSVYGGDPSKQAPAVYDYDGTGADFNIGDTVGLLSAAIRVSHDGADNGKVIHTFNTQLTPQWEWSKFIFRADGNTNDFTALAFRRNPGGGAMVKIVSRVNGKFYTSTDNWYDPVHNPNVFALDEYMHVSCPALDVAGTINVVIESDYDYVKVWFNGVLGYSTTLVHRVAAGTGIFALSAASSNSNLRITDAHCYTPALASMNNAINGENVVYSPLGGGGAQSEMNAGGATLTPGSSREGAALFTMPEIKTGRIVQTYSFSLDTPNSDIYDWYTVVLRASPSMDQYLAFRIRRFSGHIGMFARFKTQTAEGKTKYLQCSYASNEPFELDDDIYSIFPRKQLPDEVAEGDVFHLTVVSDENGIVVYNGNREIYTADFGALTLENEMTNPALDVTKVPDYIAAIPVATGMMHGPNGGYTGASYTGVNCYYEGAALEDTLKDTFLTGITYNGAPLEGFTPGSFEYDITVGGSDAVDKTALSCTAGEGTSVSDFVWSVNQKTGFEEATVTATRGETSWTYTFTFEKYDAPQPFVPETWEEEGGESDKGCKKSAAGTGIAAAAVLAAALFAVKKGGVR